MEQKDSNFPIHAFVLVASRRTSAPQRWKYLGLLEYLRHYPDSQLDSNGKVRTVWLFEFRIHQESALISLEMDAVMSKQILAASRERVLNSGDDQVMVGEHEQSDNMEETEQIRGRLLAMEPRKFEFFIKDLLVHCGFNNVCVTKFSADGGVDVNASASGRIWPFEGTLVQVQAKRWLHSVGRKEIAELRGSLQPFARGAVVTTSHFSRAAIEESREEGKNPITLVDGFRLSRIVIAERFPLPPHR